VIIYYYYIFGLYEEDVCFLWGRTWFFKYYVHEHLASKQCRIFLEAHKPSHMWYLCYV